MSIGIGPEQQQRLPCNRAEDSFAYSNRHDRKGEPAKQAQYNHDLPVEIFADRYLINVSSIANAAIKPMSSKMPFTLFMTVSVRSSRSYPDPCGSKTANFATSQTLLQQIQ